MPLVPRAHSCSGCTPLASREDMDLLKEALHLDSGTWSMPAFISTSDVWSSSAEDNNTN